MASIKVKKKVERMSDQRYRLKVWVSETTDNIPAQVFMYVRLPYMPERDDPEDRFEKVCCYADMLLYPPNEPDTENPYFRKGYLDLVFTSFSSLTSYFDDIIEAPLQYLINDIVKTNTASEVEEESSLDA